MQEPLWLWLLLALALLVLLDLITIKRKLGRTELELAERSDAWLKMNSQRHKLATANEVRDRVMTACRTCCCHAQSCCQSSGCAAQAATVI